MAIKEGYQLRREANLLRNEWNRRSRESELIGGIIGMSVFTAIALTGLSLGQYYFPEYFSADYYHAQIIEKTIND